jgi:membrane protein implicated in regulation of membrane protease activity
MIYLYAAALLFGGVMIGASLLFGGDHHNGEVLHTHDVGAEGWLPFGSMRFWTFLFFVFGLTGGLFTLTDSMSEWPAFLVSCVVGLITAAGATTALKQLSKRQVSSGVQQEDYIGVTARALLPMSSKKLGKIRVHLKGQTHDLQAIIEGNDEVQPKDEVMIVEINDEIAKVVKSNR